MIAHGPEVWSEKASSSDFAKQSDPFFNSLHYKVHKFTEIYYFLQYFILKNAYLAKEKVPSYLEELNITWHQ